MGIDEEGDRLGHGPPVIVLRMPLERANLAQEVVELIGVGEERPVEVPRVPIEQDATEVEYHSSDGCLVEQCQRTTVRT